jgi:hypothetical protein
MIGRTTIKVGKLLYQLQNPVRIMTGYGMSEQCRGFRQVFDFIASSLCAVLAARRKLGDAGRYAFRKAERSALIVPDSVFNCNKSF